MVVFLGWLKMHHRLEISRPKGGGRGGGQRQDVYLLNGENRPAIDGPVGSINSRASRTYKQNLTDQQQPRVKREVSDPLQDDGATTFSLLFLLLCSIRHCRHRHCRHRRGRKEKNYADLPCLIHFHRSHHTTLYVQHHDHSKTFTRHSNQTQASSTACPLRTSCDRFNNHRPTIFSSYTLSYSRLVLGTQQRPQYPFRLPKTFRNTNTTKRKTTQELPHNPHFQVFTQDKKTRSR